MADLHQWQSAVPDGEQLVAVAPMFADWRGPSAVASWWCAVVGFLSGLVFSLASSFAPNLPWLALISLSYVAVAVGPLLWLRRRRKRHPRPTGMAAVVDWMKGRGPVLLVTGTRVLATAIQSPNHSGRPRPSGLARELPGLAAIEAVEDRLVLTFEDGSTAVLSQRWPMPGAAARVAELAAPVLRRRQPSGAGGTL